jgi:putative ABC transport system substrate-binding protein
VLWPNPPATFEDFRAGLRPGGNLTGTTRMLSEMSAKHVELLKQAVPSLSRLAILWNPGNSSHTPALKAAETTALAVDPDGSRAG